MVQRQIRLAWPISLDGTTLTVVPRFNRGIQHAAASPLRHHGLWNTGSPGQAGRRREENLRSRVRRENSAKLLPPGGERLTKRALARGALFDRDDGAAL